MSKVVFVCVLIHGSGVLSSVEIVYKVAINYRGTFCVENCVRDNYSAVTML